METVQAAEISGDKDLIHVQDKEYSSTPSDVVAADPDAPSREVSSARQRMSDLFTIFCSGFALISDGYQNNLM